MEKESSEDEDEYKDRVKGGARPPPTITAPLITAPLEGPGLEPDGPCFFLNERLIGIKKAGVQMFAVFRTIYEEVIEKD